MEHILLGAFAAAVAVELAYNHFLHQLSRDNPVPTQLTFYIHPFPSIYYGPMGIEDDEVIRYDNDADAYEAAVGRQQLQITAISTP